MVGVCSRRGANLRGGAYSRGCGKNNNSLYMVCIRVVRRLYAVVHMLYVSCTCVVNGVVCGLYAALYACTQGLAVLHRVLILTHEHEHV